MLYELKDIRLSKGLKRQQVADDLDVPLGTYRNWEQCLYMPQDNDMLLKIARYFNISIEELFGFDLINPGGMAHVYKASPITDTVTVPLFGRIAAGLPLEMDAVEDHIQLSKSLHERYPESFFLRVEGTSMNQVLPNGAYALIDPSKKNDDVLTGHIYALCINGYDATIKAVRKLAHGLALVPDSSDPTHKVQVFDDEELEEDPSKKITIIGEVVWYTVPEDFMSRYKYEMIDL